MAFLVTLGIFYASLHSHRPLYNKRSFTPLHFIPNAQSTAAAAAHATPRPATTRILESEAHTVAYHNDVRFLSVCSFISYLPLNMYRRTTSTHITILISKECTPYADIHIFGKFVRYGVMAACAIATVVLLLSSNS